MLAGTIGKLKVPLALFALTGSNPKIKRSSIAPPESGATEDGDPGGIRTRDFLDENQMS
jgi:hypothetical protein